MSFEEWYNMIVKEAERHGYKICEGCGEVVRK